MRLKAIIAAAAVLCATTAFAQGTVQLPSFSYNTVGTTVTAPDGGTIGLGGVSRASSGRTERGVPMLGKLPFAGRLFNNRGIGQDYSNGYMTVTPRIIILEEEEAKLGLPDYSSGAPIGGAFSSSATRGFGQSTRELSATDVEALRLSQFVATNEVEPEQQQPTGPSPEEIRRRNEAAAAARHGEAYELFEKGIAAEESGKANVAKIYYDMAGRRAPEELKSAIESRITRLQAD